MKEILKSNGLSFTSREMGFLCSIFDKNNSGEYNLKEVSQVLFEENREKYFARKQTLPKGPFAGKLLKFSSNKRTPKIDNLKGLTNIELEMVNRVDQNNTRRVFKERSVKQKCGILMQHLMKGKSNQHLKKWKIFDKDKDRYLSLEDVRATLVSSALFGPKDLNYVIDHFSKAVIQY